MRQRILVACAVVWGGLTFAAAQENGHIPVSMVEDWSSRHVIFSEDVARENRGAVLSEPRFWHQYLRRHATRPLPTFDTDRDRDREHERDSDDDRDRDRDSDDRRHKKHKKALSHRDWSFSLGGGAAGASPVQPSLCSM